MAMSKEELSALLECKICLGTYEEPKNLPCGHTYCKNCIGSILIFKENGSTEIPCPFKCELTVAIDENKTTSSLPTNCPLSHIIEEAENKKGELTSHQGKHCQQNEQCKKEVNSLCITCGVKICNQCQKVHSCKLKSFTSVTFDRKLEEARPLCQQHMSRAKQVCLDCDNIFICVYCVNREHKDHRKKGIVEFGEEAKTWFKSFTDTFEDTKIVSENIARIYNKAMIKFGSEREKLVEELEIRKLKRVGQFLELLNTEHKNILNQFDKKTQEFRQIIFLKGYTDSTKVNQASEYINTLELKTHFELVAEKAEIEQQLRRLTVFPTIVRCFNLHLSMFNNGNLYVNPLGKVDISIDFVNTASVESGDKDVYANNIPKTSIQCNQLEIKRNLLDLVEDLNVNERLTSLAKVVKRPQNDAKLKSTPTPKNFDQFEDVATIIKSGLIKTFLTLFSKQPSIAKENNDGDTLIIVAALYNKPAIVKALIEAGSDVHFVHLNKCSAYHYSAYHGYYDVLKLLVNHDNTHINVVDDDRSTPLYYASANGHIDCVKLLLSIPHIDVNMSDIYGNRPCDSSYETVRRLLKEHRRK